VAPTLLVLARARARPRTPYPPPTPAPRRHGRSTRLPRHSARSRGARAAAGLTHDGARAPDIVSTATSR
jgi:hypothetical protein